jgi:hypothetical protein
VPSLAARAVLQDFIGPMRRSLLHLSKKKQMLTICANVEAMLPPQSHQERAHLLRLVAKAVALLDEGVGRFGG